MRVLLVNRETHAPQAEVEARLGELMRDLADYTLILRNAKGAGRVAHQWARKVGIPVEFVTVTEWDARDKVKFTPERRAELILRSANPGLILPFWPDHLGRLIIDLAQERGVPIARPRPKRRDADLPAVVSVWA